MSIISRPSYRWRLEYDEVDYYSYSYRRGLYTNVYFLLSVCVLSAFNCALVIKPHAVLQVFISSFLVILLKVRHLQPQCLLIE